MEERTFTASCDGSSQKYVSILPPGYDVAHRHDLLIALHGHGSDRWQFASDERDECRAARAVATARGMIFISPDYRAPTSWMGPNAESDVVDLIAHLRQSLNVKRVFLCGASMGGAAALTFVALHPDLIVGVASMNGIANHLEFDGFQDAISESFGGTKEYIPEEYRKRSAEFHVDGLTMPVGLTTSGQDTVTPPQSVLRLAESLRGMSPHLHHIHREAEGHRTNYADGEAVLTFVIENAPDTP
jgi:dipeptidyl aminopeptidase/acylaminoacyl peptidase